VGLVPAAGIHEADAHRRGAAAGIRCKFGVKTDREFQGSSRRHIWPRNSRQQGKDAVAQILNWHTTLTGASDNFTRIDWVLAAECARAAEC